MYCAHRGSIQRRCCPHHDQSQSPHEYTIGVHYDRAKPTTALQILTLVPGIITMPFAEHTFCPGCDNLAEETISKTISR